MFKNAETSSARQCLSIAVLLPLAKAPLLLVLLAAV
jgi:hypothetical protein